MCLNYYLKSLLLRGRMKQRLCETNPIKRLDRTTWNIPRTGAVFRTNRQHRTLIHARNRPVVCGCSRITFTLQTDVRNTDQMVRKVAMSRHRGLCSDQRGRNGVR
jgi:hypothetical protein